MKKVICIIVAILAVAIAFKFPIKNKIYKYIDLDNNWGESNYCISKYDNLYCKKDDILMLVKQYYYET